jgi:hypothetical protein
LDRLGARALRGVHVAAEPMRLLNERTRRGRVESLR